MPLGAHAVDNELNIELSSCANLIEERLHFVEKEIADASVDVERDLDELIASYFREISDDDVKEKIIKFREKNRDILLRSKLESLKKVQDKLISYRAKIKYITTAPIITGNIG